jgi:hypothetical protein
MASPPYDPADRHVDLTEQAPAVSSDPSSAVWNSTEAPGDYSYIPPHRQSFSFVGFVLTSQTRKEYITS